MKSNYELLNLKTLGDDRGSLIAIEEGYNVPFDISNYSPHSNYEIYLNISSNISKIYKIDKIRPVLIFQNNFLNRMLGETSYNDVVVLPLSSQIRENDFSYYLLVQEKLGKESVVLCNAIK